jgi:hypothetical protein
MKSARSFVCLATSLLHQNKQPAFHGFLQFCIQLDQRFHWFFLFGVSAQTYFISSIACG